MSARTRTRRRGSVYIVVLGAAMIVGTIALATSGIGRLALRNALDQRDRRQAQIAARSGVEYALNWINQHPTWRSTLTSGVMSADLTAGKVVFSWSVTDEDGDLANDTRDHAVVRAVGKSGNARAALEVTVEPSAVALTCLESAAHASGAVTIGANATVQRNGGVTSNNSGSAYLASPVKTMPGNDVFDYYVSRGTEIPITSLPTSGGNRQFTLRILSRRLNPFGTPNPWGIYWIDCQGANVELMWSRVYGTLVLLNAGSGTKISDVAIYQPEAPNYPSLMVQGDLTIDLYSSTVILGIPIGSRERIQESALFTNYNPVGAPYAGITDNDTSDLWPASLDGIVYVTGTATIQDHAAIRGSLVAGAIAVSANKTLTLEYQPYAKDYPPPGFTNGPGVRPLPGTWREVGL